MEVADVGSGTGLLTNLFVENGNNTFAVEPNQPMREAGEDWLGGRATTARTVAPKQPDCRITAWI
ncbi:MAG: hypothetical protein ACNYPI_02575 [Arenicellales bacterium WSBS_2016_MAG_OTU3]